MMYMELHALEQIDSVASLHSTTPAWMRVAAPCHSSCANTRTPWGMARWVERIPTPLRYLIRRLQGGFVWEWIDHGIRRRTVGDREFFAYGGDFGEPFHDVNLVIDGLVFPTGLPHPGCSGTRRSSSPFPS